VYRCSRCRAEIEEGFDRCWKCGEPVPADLLEYDAEAPEPGAELDQAAIGPTGPTARYEVFRGTISSWDTLFAEAAAFATGIGPDRVIGISHSADQHDGVVTVWYWEHDDDSGLDA
jgi:hypothetical protein